MTQQDRNIAVELETVTTNEAFDALGDAWDDLYRRCPTAPYFVSFDWLRSAWECVAQPNGHELRIVVGRLPDRTVLVWPLVIVGDGVARMLGSDQFEYRDVLVEEHPRRRTWMADAWAHIAGMPDVDSVEIFNVRADSALASLFGPGRLPANSEAYHCVTIDCRADGCWDDYIMTLSKPIRRNLRRQPKRLAAQGDVQWRWFTEPGDIEMATEWLFDRKQAWLDADKSPIAAAAAYGGAQHRLFVRRSSCRAAATGNLVFGGVLVDGQIVGVVLAVRDARALYILYMAYDMAFSSFSPGQIALARAVRSAFDAGLEQVDITIGDADWKHTWANSGYALSNYYLACSIRGRIRSRWQASVLRMTMAAALARIGLPGFIV